MGSGDARRHVPALPPVGGNAAGAAYCHHYLVTENCCAGKTLVDTTLLLCSSVSESAMYVCKERPVHSPLYPPCTSPTHTITARADHPVRDPAHAVAFTTAAAIGGAGSVHRRTGMRTARALPGHRNRPGSPRATDCRQNPPPASPVNHTRCSADHRPAWRWDAGPDVRRAVGVCMMGRARGSHLTSTTGPRHTASVRHLAGHPVAKKLKNRGCKMILKEPHARAP